MVAGSVFDLDSFRNRLVALVDLLPGESAQIEHRPRFAHGTLVLADHSRKGEILTASLSKQLDPHWIQTKGDKFEPKEERSRVVQGSSPGVHSPPVSRQSLSVVPTSNCQNSQQAEPLIGEERKPPPPPVPPKSSTTTTTVRREERLLEEHLRSAGDSPQRRIEQENSAQLPQTCGGTVERVLRSADSGIGDPKTFFDSEGSSGAEDLEVRESLKNVERWKEYDRLNGGNNEVLRETRIEHRREERHWSTTNRKGSNGGRVREDDPTIREAIRILEASCQILDEATQRLNASKLQSLQRPYEQRDGMNFRFPSEVRQSILSRLTPTAAPTATTTRTETTMRITKETTILEQ